MINKTSGWAYHHFQAKFQIISAIKFQFKHVFASNLSELTNLSIRKSRAYFFIFTLMKAFLLFMQFSDQINCFIFPKCQEQHS